MGFLFSTRILRIIKIVGFNGWIIRDDFFAMASNILKLGMSDQNV